MNGSRSSLALSGDILTVSIAEAAQITSLHRVTIYRHIKAGSLKSVKVGNRRLVDMQSLRKLVGVAA